MGNDRRDAVARLTQPAEPAALDVAIRAYLQTGVGPGRGSTGRRPAAHLVVLDTETTIDPTQAFTFGSYRFYDVHLDEGADGQRVRLSCAEEGLIYADDLSDRDPDGYAVLKRYAAAQPAAVDPLAPDANWVLRLLSRSDFVERLFWQAGYKLRATLVGFNLPFDLSRLAVGWGIARTGVPRKKHPTSGAGSASAEDLTPPEDRTADQPGGESGWTASGRRRPDALAGGISLQFWLDDRFKFRIAIKTIDSKRALKQFRSPAEIDQQDLGDGGKPFRGHLLDLRTLVFALTNTGHSLASACTAFGVEHGKDDSAAHGTIAADYVTYNRHDVRATAELYAAVLSEYLRHPIALQETQAYSPASIAKSYLRAQGIRPVLARQPDFPVELLGAAMSAFYGGRAECQIRRVPLPVQLVDFTSMYPTVDTLLGLWQLLTAGRVDPVEATGQVRDLLTTVTFDACFDPALWPQLVGLAQIIPDGDVLPVRARYGSTNNWTIGVNPLTADRPLWYTLPDLVAATLLSGKPPRVLRAVRLVARGQATGLRPVQLRGQVRIDPASEDFFRVVVEQRQQIRQPVAAHPDDCRCARCRLAGFLKVLANAGSYGIFAEMRRRELGPRRVETVSVHDGERAFTCRTAAPEDPGDWCFPPIAACITGAARLMLALLERSVTDAGGSWMFCDTDSMAIVAIPTGGLLPCPGGQYQLPDGTPAVRALSHDQVEGIRRRFDTLNPYPRQLVPDLLKAETTADCYAISAKRYELHRHRDGGVEVVYSSEERDDELDDDEEPPADGVDTPTAVVKRSEHGLGHLLNPTDPESVDRDWTRQAWTWLVETELGVAGSEPDWLDRPALTRVTATTPHLLDPFTQWNAGKPYSEQVKPFNFLLAAHLAPFGAPPGVDPERLRLITAYNSDPTSWSHLRFWNLYGPAAAPYRVSTGRPDQLAADQVRVATYRSVLADYLRHPEQKFLGPEGQPCRAATRGQLQRRPVVFGRLYRIGKEANRLDDVQAGLVGDAGEVVNQYDDPADREQLDHDLQTLAHFTDQQIAERAGISRAQISRVRRGVTRQPHPRHRQALARLAREVRRETAAWAEACASGGERHDGEGAGLT